MLNTCTQPKALIENSLESEPEALAETITLYDATTIGQLKWPENRDGEFAKKFLEPLIKKGVSEYISNIDGEMFALQIEELVFPVLLPRQNKLNSHVCSPYNHYITLGKENVNLFKNPFVIKMIQALLFPVDQIASLGNLDSVVYVNHWLSATDLYPMGIKKEQFSKIIDFLQKRFPDRAIIFRSLNTISAPYMADLEHLNCNLIPSRYVYLTDCSNEKNFQKRVFKSDLKLWNQSIPNSFEYVDEEHAKAEDCVDFFYLQRLLYIIQHTHLHPQYKEQYIQLLFANQLLRFKSLRRDGKCVGVVGYLEREGVMYHPFIGFDKHDPDHSIIFRLLNTALLEEAREKKVLFHQSAGSSFYKSIRQAEGTLEYSAVFTHHLPRKQKMAWFLLSKFINAFGPNLMRRY